MTAETSTKKEPRPWLTVLALIFIIVAVIALFLFFTREKPKDFDSLYNRTLEGKESDINFMYNGFVFVKTDLLWETLVVKKGKTELTEYQLSTYYSPRELEDISSPTIPPVYVQTKNQWILSFPTNLSSSITIAGVEVGKVFGSRYGLFNKPVIQAVSAPYSGSFPVLTCANASTTTGVITFEVSNVTEISMAGNCIYIRGQTDMDVLRAADRFVLTILGIMQ